MSRLALRQVRTLSHPTLPRDVRPRWSTLALLIGLSLGAAGGALAGPAQGQMSGLATRTLFPIGGGYEEALKGYARQVARHAQGPTVDIVMVPAAFADDPVLPEDPVILAEDVAILQAVCDAVVSRVQFPGGCAVRSVPLFVPADAENPAIVQALSQPNLDGIFFNGGDQAYAMRVLARSSAEAAMATAAERGVVVGGTSAGAAVESVGMNAGYTDAGDSTNALQKASIDLWLGQTPARRGLSFGSRQVIIDQHVYGRGRLGRMLNAGAQTADALGNGGLLGVGLDYDTGAAITQDRWMSDVSGVSSAVLVDFQSAGATYRWAGEAQALSAHHVLTHLMVPSAALRFDLAQREPVLRGHRLGWEGRAPASLQPVSEHRATVILGGDVSQDLAGPVVQAFVQQAGAQRKQRLLVLATAYALADDAQQAAQAYASALRAAGWQGDVRVQVVQSGPGAQGLAWPDAAQLAQVGGLIVLGGDQTLVSAAVAAPACRPFLRQALKQLPVVMFDHAMTAAVGERFDAVPEDDSADAATLAFTASHAQIKPGLGLVQGMFETRLQVDKRWGRLYGLGAASGRSGERNERDERDNREGEGRAASGVHGISEDTAVVLQGRQARVVGRNPVVTLDARRATFIRGDNGTLGALNVLLDVHEPGEALGR
jgi:cyanophycinase